MSGPIKKGQIDQAPTPQNTPASAAGSYMPKAETPSIPSTIDEKNELLKGMLANNPHLLASIQAKLGQLVGTDSGYVEGLSKKVKRNLYGLKSLQEKQYEIEADFQAELLELERKFQLLYEPIFEQRKKYVTGEVEPTKEEIENGKAILEAEEDNEDAEDEEKEEDEDEQEDGEKADSEEKGVPYFWLTAMQNLPAIADMISERDVEVLEHLINVKMEYIDKPGFKLIFEFSKNEFFKNKELVKTYYYQKELGYTGEFVYDHAEGDEIEWADNAHNVTVTIELRKQRNKHTKQVRTIEKTTPTYSFFNFFTPPVMPGTNGDDEEEFEDIDEELEESLQNDYSVGELIKEKLIPRAVDWFTGHALQYEADFAEEEDEEEYDDDGEDDDDEGDGDDDSDEDDDDTKQKPECKQQ